MPRGHVKPAGTLPRLPWGDPIRAGGGFLPAPAGDPCPAIIRDVTTFARAWFAGDTGAMVACLHPDFVHRLVEARGPGAAEPRDLVRAGLGPQGRLGSALAPALCRVSVRILEVRSRSASAVAELGPWALHLHLARSGARWMIVNVLWEMTSN